MNIFTGVLTQNVGVQVGADEVAGWLYVILGNHGDEPAMPGRCPRCAADYGRRKRIKTPLRNHRTGFQKACQVLASALYREMPVGVPRKLVIFSDESVHGEFGLAASWPNVALEIQAWIDDPVNQLVIDDVLEALLVGTQLEQEQGFRQEMITFLRDDLVGIITDIVNNRSFTQDALSERLSHAGQLPMFGFPTRVRLLFTRWPTVGNP